MPKPSGADMKTVRLAPLPQPPSRPIMHQVVPKGPKVDPMSPGAPKIAADLKPDPSANELVDQFNRTAKNPGGIDPRQMRY
jgi:hypothetical protein